MVCVFRTTLTRQMAPSNQNRRHLALKNVYEDRSSIHDDQSHI